MDDRCWYEAEALMPDLTSHRHEILGASEEEIERRMRNHYPDAVATWCTKEQIRRTIRIAPDFGRG